MNDLRKLSRNKYKRFLRSDNYPYLCSPKKLKNADVA